MTACWRGWPDDGRQRHSGPDRGSCAINSGCPPWGRSRCPDSPPPGTATPLETLLEVLEQEAEDRRQRRIGRLRTASRLPAGKTWETFEHDRVPLALRQQLGELAERQLRRPRRQRAGLRTARHREDPCTCAPWATGWWKPDARSLFAPAYRLVQDLLARQARPGATATITKARQLRLPAAGRPGVPAPKGPKSPRCSSRSSPNATNAGPWASRPTLVFSQWEHIFRQPNGHGCGHRPGGPPLGHPGIRRPQLPHRSGPAAQSGTGGEPARIIDGTGKSS